MNEQAHHTCFQSEVNLFQCLSLPLLHFKKTLWGEASKHVALQVFFQDCNRVPATKQTESFLSSYLF